MFIVTQRRNSVINMDNIVDVYQFGEKILVGTAISQEQIIAKYESEERAAEVFEEMLKTAFPPFGMVFKNCEIDLTDVENLKRMGAGIICVNGENADVKTFEWGVYYMPEE